MGGVLALAGLALWWFSYKQEHQKLSCISLPDGTSVSVFKNSLNYKLAAYLASASRDAPKTFHFDHVIFRPSSTDLTQGSVQNVSDLATILKAYPEVQIHLTDHSGSPVRLNVNEKLSVDRANAVKGVLVSAGVGPERISTTGFGWTRPIETDQAEHRHTKSRWLDLTVMPTKEMMQPRPAA